MDRTIEMNYTVDETLMASYFNVHAKLEDRRFHAKASANDSDASQGPRVIVLGLTGPGTSTLSRMLLSNAAKEGWKPTFVDLDVGQGAITVPGCIAATPVEVPIDPMIGIPLERPLVYFFGHKSPDANLELYKVLVNELAQTLDRQFSENAELRASGMVIKTIGWIEGTGYKLLLHAIDTFKASVVLVLGQEKLYNMLRGDVHGNVDVVELQQSGGVLSNNTKLRQQLRELRVREYFYGLRNELTPHSNIVNFTDLSIYRVGGGPQAPRWCSNVTRLSPVTIDMGLLNSVLGVSYAKHPHEIVFSNIAGFIYITDIDIQRRVITYLAPIAGELPGVFLIVGNVTCA